MDTIKIIEIVAFTLPSIITGGVAYYFFKTHIQHEDNGRKYIIQKENNKEALPIKLQAYERMTLFLERINPTKLLVRIAPFNEDKHDYEHYLIQQIEQEFEHNLAQQIYLSEDCWTVICNSKNAIIQTLRAASKQEEIKTAQALRELVLTDLVQKVAPTHNALNYLKTEVGIILGR